MKNVSDKVMMVKQGITNLCYGFFSTLANPTRLAIIETLSERPMSVTEIVESIGQEQSMVSHNLRPLVQCNFVQVRREGKHRIYTLNQETIEPLLETVQNHFEKYCGNGVNCPHRDWSETSSME
ncbi:MAG: metalloregulator ArsR/SmtB family transcription factor [Candidatus Bathyarchaeota archaeon]|nr:metalloregulator ArsR/SmtB family transcription factor [Candidatus Bathyarchaeota archaeon]